MTQGTRLLKTGIDGFDTVLDGGFPEARIYLVQGDPGVGKTTLSMQFLREGAAHGERTLYVSLSETREELMAVAAAHGWTLDGIDIYEMSIGDDTDLPAEENTLYLPAEVELGERMRALLAKVERVQPRRLIIDSCSELRLLAQTPLRFRRQILALKHEMVRRGCTVLLLENPTSPQGDVLLQSLVHGVVHLELLSPGFGGDRRRLRVRKLREIAYRGGYHDFSITTGGLVVYPRLIASEHHHVFVPEPLSSGVEDLDTLLGGGLDRGTSALFLGPAGAGKSALATLYAVAAARRGERVAMFSFDEGLGTLFARARALGMDLTPEVEAGLIMVQQVDPAELSPGEFAEKVRDVVLNGGAQVVVIDSLNGFMHAMPEEQHMLLQLHELLSFLRQRGVLTLLLLAQHGLMGSMATPVDVSYLADTVVLFRYFEASGRVRKAISVVKKRSGNHEDTIREIGMGPQGFEIGPPLERFRGIMSGIPEFVGDAGVAGPLLGKPRG